MLAVSKPSRLLFAMLCTALLTLALPTGSALAKQSHSHSYAKLSDYAKHGKRSHRDKHAKRLHGRKYAKLFRSARQNQHEVCKDLKGTTRGLYGLCLVYCESQSCDAESAEAGLCTRQKFNLRVLENYNRIREAKYPDAMAMPCLNNQNSDDVAEDEVVAEVEDEVVVEDEIVATPSPCPCVSEQEVDETDWNSCENESGASVLVGEGVEGMRVLRFDPNPYATSCSFTAQNIDREFALVDEQQANACSNMVEMATESNGISCAGSTEEEVNDNY
jgi:hypothetical protein